ncbi:MAG: phospholipase [Caulobacter sp.]|nr:phospholipase [Caulobacter sp.]
MTQPSPPESPLHGPGVIPAGKAPTSLVIFLHGYGSNGADLISLAPYFQAALPDAAYLAPNAPEECPGAPDGYQWWPIVTLSREERAYGAYMAAPAVHAFIDAMLARFNLTEERLVLVGFSQGTMMALEVGLRRERPLAGIIGYSGMIADDTRLEAEIRSRPPVLLVHGDEDPVLPVSHFHDAKATLERLAVPLTTHISPGLGHSIDPAGLALGVDFLKRVLPGPKTWSSTGGTVRMSTTGKMQ